MARTRIDKLLVEQGHYPSRERAQAALMAGIVWVDGARVDKAGAPVKEDAQIEIRGSEHPYVSRGGLKLARALDVFGWDPAALRAVDLGASTGGFTDCLLQRGAAAVVAVDVGRGQLDLKLRNDPRVTVMEKLNARYLTREQLPYLADLVTADLAFISLKLIYPVIAAILAPQARGAVLLIKPQFEAGREQTRKGVVTDPAVHRQVLVSCLSALEPHGLVPTRLTYSPVRGPAGNIEFLAGVERGGDKLENDMIDEVVRAAHVEL